MKRVFIVIISMFLGAVLFAETVSQIKITGLKKTKESYLQDILKGYVGKDSDELDLKEIETLLQAEGLFSEISVGYLTENCDTLSVDLKEKITFIPLPFASYSSDGFMGGFMLMNMNAFGKKNMHVTGGIFSKNMQMGMVTFSKPAVDPAHPGFSAFASFAHRNDTITDFDDNTLNEYEYILARGQFNVNEKFTRNLSGSAGINYVFMDFFEGDSGCLNQWNVVSTLSYDTIDFNGWYLNTNGVSLSGSVGYSTENKLVEGIKFCANYTLPIVPRIRTLWRIGGKMDSRVHPLLKASRTDVGSTIMYSGFKTNRIAGGMFSLEGALCKAKFGTLSLYGTYEFFVAEELKNDDFVWCHGPGAGVKLYMKQIAFPAMNMGFSYNVNQNFFKFVIAFGMSF